jgi:DNA-binding GntR family transcriptional regulator
MTTSRFLELRTIRIRLEGLAISKAALNRSAAELKKMSEYEQLFEIERKKIDPDGRAAVRINKNLHFAIYRSARMPALLKMIESLWLQIGPVLNYDLAMNSDRLMNREAHIHHKNMVSAIKIKDADAAEAALISDLMSASELILKKNVLSEDQ